jgi:hypothetical protein
VPWSQGNESLSEAVCQLEAMYAFPIFVFTLLLRMSLLLVILVLLAFLILIVVLFLLVRSFADISFSLLDFGLLDYSLARTRCGMLTRKRVIVRSYLISTRRHVCVYFDACLFLSIFPAVSNLIDVISF